MGSDTKPDLRNLAADISDAAKALRRVGPVCRALCERLGIEVEDAERLVTP